jgi:hypothetical protein
MVIYRFNVILIKIPMMFSTEKRILKFTRKHKRFRIANTEQKYPSNAGDTTMPYFKLYYRAMVAQIAWDWHTNRHVDQWAQK